MYVCTVIHPNIIDMLTWSVPLKYMPVVVIFKAKNYYLDLEKRQCLAALYWLLRWRWPALWHEVQIPCEMEHTNTSKANPKSNGLRLFHLVCFKNKTRCEYGRNAHESTYHFNQSCFFLLFRLYPLKFIMFLKEIDWYTGNFVYIFDLV